MPKKSFKSNPAMAFIGNNTQDTQDTQDTRALSSVDSIKTIPVHYRLNLKLKREYQEYLEQVSWHDRKSITQYINDLIAMDKAKREGI